MLLIQTRDLFLDGRIFNKIQVLRCFFISSLYRLQSKRAFPRDPLRCFVYVLYKVLDRVFLLWRGLLAELIQPPHDIQKLRPLPALFTPHPVSRGSFFIRRLLLAQPFVRNGAFRSDNG